MSLLVRPVTLMQPLSDVTVCEGDIAQLEVKFSQENVEGSWMKNGNLIAASDRIHIVIDKLTHKLLIEDTKKDDNGMYSFVVPAQEISTNGKLTIQGEFIFYINFQFQTVTLSKLTKLLIFFVLQLLAFWHHSRTSHQLREPKLLWRLRSLLQMSAP